MNPNIRATVVGSYPVPSWLAGNTSYLVELAVFLNAAKEAGL
ncbi:MAG: hypothetical protein ABR920_10815 [Terriglobales bacterium]